MIPNSAPMAAVYLTAKKELFSRPVAAWTSVGGIQAFAAWSDGDMRLARNPETTDTFLGLWTGGWRPTYDEMSTLLPDHTPGTPHPLAVHVTVRETAAGPHSPSVWEARLTHDDTRFVADAPTVDKLREKLRVLGTYHVDCVVHLGER